MNHNVLRLIADKLDDYVDYYSFLLCSKFFYTSCKGRAKEGLCRRGDKLVWTKESLRCETTHFGQGFAMKINGQLRAHVGMHVSKVRAKAYQMSSVLEVGHLRGGVTLNFQNGYEAHKMQLWTTHALCAFKRNLLK
jgi:hypothetical protein